MDALKTAAGPAVMEPQPKKRKKKRKTLRIIITLGIILIVVAGIVYGLLKLFHKAEAEKHILTDIVQRGSIQSTVIGSGVTKAKDSASITLSSGGTVLEVFVNEGDQVFAGDQLYTIDSTDAQAAVEDARKTVANYEKQLKAIKEAYNYLTVTAEYSGTLLDVADIKAGDQVGVGQKIATLVDDSKMKLTLYFNYAYENDIKIGQTAVVSIPSSMSQIEGRVTDINYVRKVTPEGSILFQAVITLDNPGTLTAGTGASAVLTGAAGEAVYPYEAGELEYYRSTDIITKAQGEASAVNLLDYAPVKAGELLLKLDAEDNDEQVAALKPAPRRPREARKGAENLNNFNALSPMNGRCCHSLVPEKGRIRARRHKYRRHVGHDGSPDRPDQYRLRQARHDVPDNPVGRNGTESFIGIIETVSLEGKFENGYSYYPAVIKVDNRKAR